MASSHIRRPREEIVSYQIASAEEETEDQQELEEDFEMEGQLRRFLIH